MSASDKTIQQHALPACSVRVERGSSPVGSGFFVAPGVVVTCAHVVVSAEAASTSASEQISIVAVDGLSYQVVDLEDFSDDEDLAVLRVASRLDHSCALVDQGVRASDELASFGFPMRHRDGAPVALRAEGWMGGQRLLKLREGQIRPGMSGAPLLNLRTGAVCGIVKRTRDANTELGGYAIPSKTLFELNPALKEANRHYHLANRTQWLDLLPSENRRLLEGDWGAPRDEARPSEDAESGRDKVEWVADGLGAEDLLLRRPLARSLAERLRRMQADDPTMSSFLVHIDGAWGSGKSTILKFLQDEVASDWLIVDFNAWRQSRVGPPWWALLVALRQQLAKQLGWWDRLWLRAAETRSRIRRTGAPYTLALVLLLALALGVFLALRPVPFTSKTGGDVARAVTAIAAALATLWAGGLVAARFLLWDSPRGARLYEQQSQGNPMENLADHFAWLVARVGRPVAFFIDDLDRCPGPYVVELLEALQTLVRDSSIRWNEQAVTGGRKDGTSPGPYFLVAADGKWIRTSYELEYDGFTASVDEPGRPLGYLFVEKLFQLRVPVPILSILDQSRYLAGLLRSGDPGAADVGEAEAVRTELANSRSDSDVVEALQRASPPVQRALAPEAVAKLTDPQVEGGTEHALEKFSGLLEPNPRAVKRFVNAFGIARVVLTLENRLVPTNSLALWTILESRWPILADHLRSRPEDVRFVGDASSAGKDTPDRLRSLYGLNGVIELVSFEAGGPLTPALISTCASGDSSTSASNS